MRFDKVLKVLFKLDAEGLHVFFDKMDSKVAKCVNLAFLAGYGVSKSTIRLKDNEEALIVSKYGSKHGVVQRQVGAGFHFFFPLGYEVVKFNMDQKSRPNKIQCQDAYNGKVLDSVVVETHLEPKGLQLLFEKLGTRYKTAIDCLVQSVVKEQISKKTPLELALMKETIKREMKLELVNKASAFNITVDNFDISALTLTI